MPFVLDASVTVSWVFPDEGDVRASEALTRLRTDGAIVPSLWWFEVRNTLLVGERRKRISEAGTAAFLNDLSQLSITLDRAPDESRILTLAREHKLTFYDAAYLELAQRLGLPLATLDAALCKAAIAGGVPILANGG